MMGKSSFIHENKNTQGQNHKLCLLESKPDEEFQNENQSQEKRAYELYEAKKYMRSELKRRYHREPLDKESLGSYLQRLQSLQASQGELQSRQDEESQSMKSAKGIEDSETCQDIKLVKGDHESINDSEALNISLWDEESQGKKSALGIEDCETCHNVKIAKGAHEDKNESNALEIFLMSGRDPGYYMQTPSGEIRKFNNIEEWRYHLLINHTTKRGRELREIRNMKSGRGQCVVGSQKDQESQKKKKKKSVKGKEDGEISQVVSLVDAQNSQPPHEPSHQDRRMSETRKAEEMRRSKQKVCLLYSDALTGSLIMVVIEASGNTLSHDSFCTVQLPYYVPNAGFGSLGSKCYVIGGDIFLRGKGQKFPRKVFVCDLDCPMKCWKEGPMLNCGKPDPIVVTVNEKLYALAGNSELWAKEKTKNVFEVFEPKYGMWRVLPNPPFLSLYEKGYSHPKFQGHTVIGSVIYLKIGNSTDQTLCAFNVNSEEWYENRSDGSFFPDGSDEVILHNLRVGDWLNRAEVVDYLLFQTSEMKLESLNVYAYDLTCRNRGCEDELINGAKFYDWDPDLKPNEVEKRLLCHDYDSESYVLLVYDEVKTVPVLGLTLIDRVIPPKTAFTSFVTHLGDNKFSLISHHLSYDSLNNTVLENVKACIFEASFIELSDGIEFNRRYVATYNVREARWVTPEMGMFQAWCKVPNDGRQSQFRRPQMLYGEKPRCYPDYDYVACQEIQKKNTFHRYVRRVNLPQY